MSQQEEDQSRYTRTLVVKPALSQLYDQLLPMSKSLEMACKTNALKRRRPVTCVYLDLGISQTVYCKSRIFRTHLVFVSWALRRDPDHSPTTFFPNQNSSTKSTRSDFYPTEMSSMRKVEDTKGRRYEVSEVRSLHDPKSACT